jgi:glutamyl-tRNA reductase
VAYFKMMRKLFYILFTGMSALSYGQEIIPFPDISENHEAVYNNLETIDDKNYALYAEDYQRALRIVDLEIEQVSNDLQNESIPERLTSLRNKKADLLKKKTALLEEAQLVEDLHKFY